MTSREIFGYALSDSLGDPSVGYTSWDWSLLGTVAYFGLQINTKGAIVHDSAWTTWNSGVLSGMLRKAHTNASKVVVTLIVHDFAPGNPRMCTALAHRATTVALAVATVRARGADGVNVDYEGLNGTCPNGHSARSMMTDFVRQLRAGFGRTYYLSAATYASSASDSLGFFDIARMSPYVDSFFVMAYDLEYSNYRHAPSHCVSFCLGPTAPLSGYYYNDTSTARQYISVVPASKVILGVPYYGRKSCVASAALNPYPTSDVTAETYLDAAAEVSDPSVRTGSFVTHRDVRDPAGQERWSTWFNKSLQCTRELYIDDAASLGRKYDLVNKDALRGVGIWALNYGGGAPELWATLSTHFAACTSLRAGTTVASPQPTSAQIRVTAAASGCARGLYQFWVKSPSGSWTLAQRYSSSPNFNFNSAARAAGTYLISAWARSAGGPGVFGTTPNRYDAFSVIQFTLTPTCSRVSVSTAPSSSAMVGNAVTINAGASSCPNPRYEFWVQPPGGTWTLSQAYSAVPIMKWTTAGKAFGSYRFSVWARDLSSPNAYDAFKAFQYTLNPVCSAVSVAAAPASAARVGTLVIFTAHVSGCPTALYEVWILPPGGTWTRVQAYAANSTFKWNSAGKPTGSYRFSVWARSTSSPGISGSKPNTFDSYSAFQYAIK